MLDFIKKFLKSKKKQEEKIILDNLDKWLDEKTKPMFKELDDKIAQMLAEINNEKQEINANLKALENAKLLNPKIPDRIKIIMEGNRASFIKKASFFFENINLEFESYDELVDKCKNAIDGLDSFAKSTERSYRVMNEFFAREMEKIAAGIKTFEDRCKILKGAISGSKVHKVKEIKANIAIIQKKIKQKENYLEELKSKKVELESDESKRLEIEQGIGKIKSSEACKSYENLLSKEKHIQLKINEMDSMLIHDFSAIERPLKKHAKISLGDETIILAYLESPINSLINDSEHKIAEILKDLKDLIQKKILELEDKKSEKAVAAIEKLNAEYLKKIKSDYISLKENMMDITAQIEDNETRKIMESESSQLNDFNGDIERINRHISNVNYELGKIDIRALKENLQKDIRESLDEEMIIL